MSKRTIDVFGYDMGHNIEIDGNNLYLVIKGTHGDIQRINIDALYFWMKELFIGDWKEKLAQQESKKEAPHESTE